MNNNLQTGLSVVNETVVKPSGATSTTQDGGAKFQAHLDSRTSTAGLLTPSGHNTLMTATSNMTGTQSAAVNTAAGAGASALPGTAVTLGTGAIPGGRGMTPGGSSDVVNMAAQGGDLQASLFQETKNMQEMQMGFNLQYLMLQSKMQQENQQFSCISNVMKTKHDTCKNSISNVR